MEKRTCYIGVVWFPANDPFLRVIGKDADVVEAVCESECEDADDRYNDDLPDDEKDPNFSPCCFDVMQGDVELTPEEAKLFDSLANDDYMSVD